MPRNGSGTYSIPNTYSDGQTITAAVVNANFSDVSSELTNSVAKDGQTVMTGALKVSAGSVSAPGIAFSADLSSGWYRIGANNWGLSISGTKLLDLSSGAAAITGTLTVSSTLTASNGFTVSDGTVTLPAGSIETADLADNAITTAKVTDANVTYAKIQNVSATNKLLGRYSSGAGVTEEIGLASTLSISGGNLGLAVAPSHILVSTATASGAAHLAVTTGFSSDYDEYEIHLTGLRPATDNVRLYLQVSVDGGSNWLAADYAWQILTYNTGGSGNDAAASDSLIGLTLPASALASNASNAGWNGVIRIWPNGSSTRKQILIDGSYMLAGGGIGWVRAVGIYNGADTAVNAIRFVAGSGNISGTARMIGIKNS